MEIIRQRAASRVALTIRQLGFQYAGGAGADEYTDALMTVFFSGGVYRLRKAILGKGELCETVVAAIECGKMRRDDNVVQARNFTDTGVKINRLKVAVRQAGVTESQRSQRLIQTLTDATGRGEMGK